MPLDRVSIHYPAGRWPETLESGSVTLDFDARHRRRARITTDQGDDVLVDLPRAVAMADGDGLQLENGTFLRVRAAPEPVVDIGHEDPHLLMRLAWHLGNRHLPTEMRGGVLRIRPDHVIEEMLLGFGATLSRTHGRFQPEGGAYGDHRHAHAPDHRPHHHV